jgi:acetyl-CoA C-acetyltransferase
MKARYGYKYGNGELVDGLPLDGLTDVYNHCAMGVCADNTAREMNISRQDQDNYAIQSYRRSAAAWAAGKFKDEIVPVEITGKKGDVTLIGEDEEYKNVNFENEGVGPEAHCQDPGFCRRRPGPDVVHHHTFAGNT